MRALGFSGSECDAVLRLLAFMLKLGNVEFEPQHNIDGSIGTRVHHQYGQSPGPAPPGPLGPRAARDPCSPSAVVCAELVEACALVGVDADELAAALGAPDLDAPLDAGNRRTYLKCIHDNKRYDNSISK